MHDGGSGVPTVGDAGGGRCRGIPDDATSEIYYAQLVEEESTVTVMAGLREVIETKGVFCALYSDRGSHYFYSPKAGSFSSASICLCMFFPST